MGAPGGPGPQCNCRPPNMVRKNRHHAGPGGPACGLPLIGLLLSGQQQVHAVCCVIHDNTEIIMDSLGPYNMLLLVFPGIRFNDQVL